GPGLGDPDRAGRRRRGRAVGRLGAAAPTALVGRVGNRHLDGTLPAQGDPLHGLRRPPARGRVVLLLLAARLGRARPSRRLPEPDAAVLAFAGVRRLLVLHAARRGSGGPVRRTRARRLRHGGARRDRERGGGGGSRAGGGRRGGWGAQP